MYLIIVLFVLLIIISYLSIKMQLTYFKVNTIPNFGHEDNSINKWNKREILYKELGNDSIVVQTNTSGHFKIFVRENDFISNYIRKEGNWYDCISLLHLWNNLPGKNEIDFFLDIGANIGICSMNFIDIGVKTISIEPLPDNVNLYTKSLLINPHMLNNVELYPYGVGQNDSTSVMKIQRGNWGGSSFLSNVKGFRSYFVSITTLDKILSKFLGKIHLACLDVEGYEYNVLLGANNTLQKKLVRHFLMEMRCEYLALNHKKEDDFYNLFEKYGYHMNKSYCKNKNDAFDIIISEN